MISVKLIHNGVGQRHGANIMADGVYVGFAATSEELVFSSPVRPGLSVEIVAIPNSDHGRPITKSYLVSGDVVAPAAPGNLNSTAFPGGYELSWDDPSEVDYRRTKIEEYQGSTLTLTKTAYISGSFYSRSGIVDATDIEVRVKHIDFAGNESDESTATFTTEDTPAGGVGIEFIYARYNATTIPSSKRPSNSWGFDNPLSADGLVWYDAAPNLSSTTPYLFSSTRRTAGQPAYNSSVTDNWTPPALIGQLGLDGEDGIGQDGDDGAGVEYIFTAYASASLPSSRRPSNSWGFDSPQTAGGQLWHDGAPSLSTSSTFLFRSERAVAGVPNVGTAVSDSWSIPVIVGRYGIDGIGQDGDDGAGVEYIFTAYASASLPSSRRPSNSWGFDSPQTAGGQLWHDGAPSLSTTSPFLFRSERAVAGVPNVGTAVSDADIWNAGYRPFRTEQKR